MFRIVRVLYVCVCAHDLLTKLKVKFVKVQLASGEMKGITVNKAFNATATKIVVIHAPKRILINGYYFSNIHYIYLYNLPKKS